VPASSPLPGTIPGAFGRTRGCRNLAPAAGDVAAARQVLAQANIDLHGLAVSLYANDDPGSPELVNAVGEQWRAAFGLVPTVVKLSWTDYLAQARTTEGFTSPFRTSWSSPVPAAGAWIQPLLLSSSAPATNLSRFNFPGIEFGYLRSVLEENDHAARRKAELRDVQAACLFMPLIPIWQGTESFVVRDNVKSATGQFARSTTGDLAIRELYVKP
jgi:ABC-type oligopeptide transport system substrate-binding subunit